ncbi:myosin-7 [Biomphalaria pfeifferi]|uniref:Myosin-7 n=1 Tax=Biomphalaria pfeifferi TaxID=112525 RepID=A0AAD8BER6_BIOPF|nr:myosin-7 [Biomphalaria pfeifferi]
MPTEALSTSRMSYVSLLCVLSSIAVSDADLVIKTEPTTLSSNLNEKLNVCCAITNNSVQQLTKLSFMTLTRLNKRNNSVYDALVYWYINESDRVEPAPHFDNQRGLITFEENRVCLIVKNATSDDATSYRCEAHGYDAEHKALQKKFTKGFVKYVDTSKEFRQNETITERSVHPGKNTSCSFNGSLSESNADYYKNQSQKFEILSAFITGPKQQSNLMQDARRVSVSSRRENKTADQVMSQLLSVTLNEQERSYLECLTAQRLCEDQIMYILGSSNQSFFEHNTNLSLPFNTPTATRPDVHTCTSNESQHSFFGIIGSELDMRMVCAFNLDRIYVFFSAHMSPQEMNIFTYMDKNSIEIILNDLLLCVNQLKGTSSEPNVQGKIMTVLDTIESLLTEINSEILSGPDKRTLNITSTSEAENGNGEDSITMNHTQLFTNYNLIENINWIIGLFKSLQSENQNDNMTKQKEQLIAILQFKDDYVFTKQPFNEFLSSLHNKIERFEGEIMESDNLLLISEMQLQLHRNYSVIKSSIQELNNSLQDILKQHFEQDLKNLSDIFDTISKIENQTMKHNQFQKDLILKIEYLTAAVENVKLLHQNDHFNLSKLLQISMNNLKDYRESSSVEISEIRNKTDNQKKLLEELNSYCQSFAHNIRNMNVAIRGDLSKLFVMSQDLKDDFIKFVKDFNDHSNSSSAEISKIKDDQERDLTMHNSGVKRVELDIRNMNSTLNTYFAKLSSQFYMIKNDLINYVKTSEIDYLKNLNKNIQKDVLFINRTFENAVDSLNIKRQKDFDNLNMLFQTANNEINTLKSESSTLKTQIDKLSRKNKELTDENMTLRQLYSQVNSRLDSEIKMLQQNVLKNVRATAHSIFHVSRSYFGRRYYLTKEKQFYCIKAAQNLCSGYGGYLAEVNDGSELNFVTSFLSSNDPCTWDSVIMIGGTDEAEEGRWVHISRGTPVVSAFWASGQPSGGRNENCQAFDKCSLLHDYSCYLSSPSRKILCEVPE